MKAFPVFLFLIVLVQPYASAQSFSKAMELYRSEQYEEAAELFLKSDDDRSQLFAGKSLLALTDYSAAVHHLRGALESPRETIRREAQYSLAMAHFGLQNYDTSLHFLYDLAESDDRTGLSTDARRFYNQILNYLSVNERYKTLYRLTSPAIQFDLVNSSKPFLDSDSYRMMVEELVKLTGDAFSRQQIRRNLLSGLNSQTGREQYPATPEGIVYNIGIILPTFDENDPDFTISRNLYYGMILAADEFNDRNSNQKVNLIFRNSAEDAETTATAFSELVWTKNVDAVIGPLFSEPATKMAELAEEFRVPMLAPLANSDELNRDYNYTFQINPTFEIHGKMMARFAVQELNLDSFAVLAEEGSLGRASALAFRHEAEELGASVSYYMEEDFTSTGFNFNKLETVFAPDAQLADSLGIEPPDAIYAPFTSEASETLTNLLMNNLESMGSNPVILGSEEWGRTILTNYQQDLFEIYYTQAIDDSPNASSFSSFRDDYEPRFGSEPDRFSRVGYDTANFLFQSLETAGNPELLSHAMRNRSLYDGLAFRIQFDGHRVNQQVFILPLTNSARLRLGEN